ncbi:MAG TPA: geranylgeranyl reductase family protein [Burkholderiaceae bacterium]|jgi:geranylgeranyl reductase family protein
MNLGLDLLPASCDVLVVGAGPAGSAAAMTLARGGRDVVLVDAHAFPRDKVCGDGLIPDAHNALRKLGVLDEVMALAQAIGFVGCIGPRGGRIDVPGALAVLPRKQLDLILCRAAVAAGVRMFAPLRFTAPIEEGDGETRSVVGAVLQQGDETREIRARWVVLASGAVPQALMAAGMSERTTPSGVALRGYVKNDAMAGKLDKLEVVWHRAVTPGYGWIFPCRDGVFNIGVGLADSHNAQRGSGKLAKRELNLRQVMDDFTRVYAPARELMAGGTLLGPMKGAPLRCTLEGARFTRPGLIVTGEAAGSTYSFSGEGIGKALETGILAAEAVLSGAPDAAVRARYEARLLELKPRFDLYARANSVNRHPWLADLLIWRAKRSPRLLKRMSGVLNETSNPGNMVGLRGLRRLFLE